jgi:hypothetical protein
MLTKLYFLQQKLNKGQQKGAYLKYTDIKNNQNYDAECRFVSLSISDSLSACFCSPVGTTLPDVTSHKTVSLVYKMLITTGTVARQCIKQASSERASQTKT